MKRLFCLVLCAVLLSGIRISAMAVSAKAAAVINGDTGEILFSQNAYERLPMASTTKIMTALLLCEHGEPEKEITVTSDMLKVEGSSMGLLAGDKVTYHDLLYGMMLASGNDAANVTAIALGGTVEQFVEKMNAKAAELGLNNTHFVTPSGLDAEGHYTTAAELAALAAYALKNESFAKAAASESAVLNYGNPPYRRSLKNHNKMLKLYEGAVGVKTGFTKKSGRCLVSAARKDGKLAVAVTLNDPDDWSDHSALLDFGLSSIKQTEYSPKTSMYAIPVIGSDTEKLQVFIEPYTVNTLETQNVNCTVNLPKFLYAPVEKGDLLGTAVYTLNGKVIGTVELKALTAAEPHSKTPGIFEIIIRNIKYIFLNF
ncbi:MAG: D-alanyl-D-alanine carboxypeptidase [Clostridia bacterium]|nr:D-alanyl-D-alanine carboxypeptidase [Clostridia bacterium]